MPKLTEQLQEVSIELKGLRCECVADPSFGLCTPCQAQEVISKAIERLEAAEKVCEAISKWLTLRHDLGNVHIEEHLTVNAGVVEGIKSALADWQRLEKGDG